jgi:hypothetical protein
VCRVEVTQDIVFRRVSDKDVVRFDVAVHETKRMEVFNCPLQVSHILCSIEGGAAAHSVVQTRIVAVEDESRYPESRLVNRKHHRNGRCLDKDVGAETRTAVSLAP